MEAHYRAFQGRLIIKVEGSNIKELFEQIGPVAEVLDGDDACGKCGSAHIYPRAREAQGFTYYELVCSDCGAKLSFGQHRDGGSLWAKRTDKDGRALDHRGWSVYLGLGPATSSPAQSQPRPQAPKPAAPTAAKPAPVAHAPKPDNPALLNFIARAKVPGQRTNVLAEVCDLIRMAHGDDAADKAYTEAIDFHGDINISEENLEGVIRHLWIASDQK